MQQQPLPGIEPALTDWFIYEDHKPPMPGWWDTSWEPGEQHARRRWFYGDDGWSAPVLPDSDPEAIKAAGPTPVFKKSEFFSLYWRGLAEPPVQPRPRVKIITEVPTRPRVRVIVEEHNGT